MSSKKENIQIARGTLERNKAIIKLYESGMKQVEIAKLFFIKNRPMTRQQVNEIVRRVS